MKFYFSDRQQQFVKYLHEFKNGIIIKYDKALLKHKFHKIIIEKEFSTLNFKKLFDYKIFPNSILIGYPQWVNESREISPGDTIVQQLNIPPTIMFSLKFIVGVRIKNVYNSDNCKGFSYETLSGHLEKGISIFKIESSNNKSTFSIETYSYPSSPLLGIFHRITSPYQNYCTEKALINMKKNLISSF